jgi:hypothetical protein
LRALLKYIQNIPVEKHQNSSASMEGKGISCLVCPQLLHDPPRRLFNLAVLGNRLMHSLKTDLRGGIRRESPRYANNQVEMGCHDPNHKYQ